MNRTTWINLVPAKKVGTRQVAILFKNEVRMTYFQVDLKTVSSQVSHNKSDPQVPWVKWLATLETSMITLYSFITNLLLLHFPEYFPWFAYITNPMVMFHPLYKNTKRWSSPAKKIEDILCHQYGNIG